MRDSLNSLEVKQYLVKANVVRTAAQVGGLRDGPQREVLQRLVRPTEHHSKLDSAKQRPSLKKQLSPSAACLWEQLQSGEALSEARPPCGIVAANSNSTLLPSSRRAAEQHIFDRRTRRRRHGQ